LNQTKRYIADTLFKPIQLFLVSPSGRSRRRGPSQESDGDLARSQRNERRAGVNARRFGRRRGAGATNRFLRTPPVNISPAPVIPDVMSLASFERRLRSGITVPSKVVPSRFYTLKQNERINVWENGKCVGYLCVSPRQTSFGDDGVVLTETYLSFYLNLALNEEGFLKVAVLQPGLRYTGRYFREMDLP